MKFRCESFLQYVPDRVFAVGLYQPLPLVKRAIIDGIDDDILFILGHVNILPPQRPEKRPETLGRKTLIF